MINGGDPRDAGHVPRRINPPARLARASQEARQGTNTRERAEAGQAGVGDEGENIF